MAETQDTTQQTAAQQQNTASTPTQTGAANPGSTEAKFTQADLDRLIDERVGRAEKRDATIKANLLKQLGLPDDANFDTLKTTIEKARDIETANLSAAEKAEKAAADALKRATDLESQLNAERAERRNDRIAAALSAAASKLHAKDTDDVLRYARDKHADILTAVMDESGTIDTKKVDTLLEKIKAEKSHYFGDGKATTQATMIPSNNGGRALSGDEAAMKRFSANNQRTIRGR